MARLLMPLPARDFDPSEAAVNWRVLRDAGHRVQFATPDGRSAAADDIMLTGQGIDLLLRKYLRRCCRTDAFSNEVL